MFVQQGAFPPMTFTATAALWLLVGESPGQLAHCSKRQQVCLPRGPRTNGRAPLLQLWQGQVLQHQPPLLIVVAVREAQLPVRPLRRRLRVLLATALHEWRCRPSRRCCCRRCQASAVGWPRLRKFQVSRSVNAHEQPCKRRFKLGR